MIPVCRCCDGLFGGGNEGSPIRALIKVDRAEEHKEGTRHPELSWLGSQAASHLTDADARVLILAISAVSADQRRMSR